MRGLFITFEGIDGCGKTTQLKIFREKLDVSGYKHIMIREPGGNDIGEKIRNILLAKDHTHMFPETELLLFEASRAQNVRDVILPAIMSGKSVICDRFADSSTAYQGYGRNLGADVVEKLNDYATGGFKPDITFLLDLSPESAMGRMDGREKENDRLDLESMEFMRRTRNGYLEIALKEPERFRVINAENDIEKISEEIFNNFQEVYNETGIRNSK